MCLSLRQLPQLPQLNQKRLRRKGLELGQPTVAACPSCPSW